MQLSITFKIHQSVEFGGYCNGGVPFPWECWGPQTRARRDRKGSFCSIRLWIIEGIQYTWKTWRQHHKKGRSPLFWLESGQWGLRKRTALAHIGRKGGDRPFTCRDFGSVLRQRDTVALVGNSTPLCLVRQCGEGVMWHVMRPVGAGSWFFPAVTDGGRFFFFLFCDLLLGWEV